MDGEDAYVALFVQWIIAWIQCPNEIPPFTMVMIDTAMMRGRRILNAVDREKRFLSIDSPFFHGIDVAAG